MGGADDFPVMVSGTLAFLTYFSPVSVGIAGLWLCGLAATIRHATDRPGRVVAGCVLPAGLTLGVLATGAVFAYHDGSPSPTYAGWLVVGLVLAHLPLAWVLVRRAGDQWPVVAASSGVWGWMSACAALVAGMSVTGDWL